MKMKKIARLCAVALMLSAGIAFPTVIRAQRVNTFTVEQQTRIDSLKQEYIKKGFSEKFAVARATTIVEKVSAVQNCVQVLEHLSLIPVVS